MKKNIMLTLSLIGAIEMDCFAMKEENKFMATAGGIEVEILDRGGGELIFDPGSEIWISTLQEYAEQRIPLPLYMSLNRKAVHKFAEVYLSIRGAKNLSLDKLANAIYSNLPKIKQGNVTLEQVIQEAEKKASSQPSKTPSFSQSSTSSSNIHTIKNSTRSNFNSLRGVKKDGNVHTFKPTRGMVHNYGSNQELNQSVDAIAGRKNEPYGIIYDSNHDSHDGNVFGERLTDALKEAEKNNNGVTTN